MARSRRSTAASSASRHGHRAQHLHLHSVQHLHFHSVQCLHFHEDLQVSSLCQSFQQHLSVALCSRILTLLHKRIKKGVQQCRDRRRLVSLHAVMMIPAAGETRGKMKVAPLVGKATRMMTEVGCGVQIVAHAGKDTVMAVAGLTRTTNDWDEKPWPVTVNHRLVSMLGERTFGAVGKTTLRWTSSKHSMWHRWS